MHIHAILNAKAGTLLDADPHEFATTIERALEAGGNDVEVELVMPGDVEAAMDRALSGKIDVLVVGGGDGTIKAAAAKLADTPVALGIIPLGTINLLARDLNIPFDPAEAAAAIASGERKAIDVASVNGDIFLCSSLLGLPTRMAELRQDLRAKGPIGRIRGYFAMARDFLATRRRFVVEVDDGRIPHRVRALSIAISNNPLAKAAGTIPTRTCIDSGQLALYLSKHQTGSAMGWAIIQRMLGKWESKREIEEFCTASVVLKSRRSHVKVSNDGEIVKLETPLHYRINPLALDVIIPKA
jgi:diacylglycerol kinase family enzyme